MEILKHLPYINHNVMAGQQSSYDREGGNMDGFGKSNFLYTDISGDKVLLDLEGPGYIYCIWGTAFDDINDHFKIYIDNDVVPRIYMTLGDFFSGKHEGFAPPLVGNRNASSGGYYCYVPIPFSKSIKITSNNVGENLFYHIGYHLYTQDSIIKSWTLDQNNDELLELWSRSGVNPNKNKETVCISNKINLNGHENITLLDIIGSQCITSIKLNVPGITIPRFNMPSNYGRGHKGFSKFVVAIDPKNDGVVLSRMMDYGVANQKAEVYVDEELVGTWFDQDCNLACRFFVSEFSIPSKYTSRKSEINVRIKFVESSSEWNEFQYWIYSIINDIKILTDTLDLGNKNSESFHNYIIETMLWEGERIFKGTECKSTIKDIGREHTGSSQFKLILNPNNNGVYLKRRFRYHSLHQTAIVYVDEILVGEWDYNDRNGLESWRDSSFYIPRIYTSGKEKVNITIKNNSADNSWNEYRYEMYCILGDGNVTTDMLDIGDPSSELSHEYMINNETWLGESVLQYLPVRDDAEDLLNNLWIRAYWDDEENPSIDAPIGSFFGMGQFGPGEIKTIAVGINENDDMYMYFYMPFKKNGQIQLINKLDSAIDNIFFEINYTDSFDMSDNMGYFKTFFNPQILTADNDNDVLFLDVEGSGCLLGVVDSMAGQLSRGYLEGDERIYVDGSKSPVIHGTGTEDFFHGAWYFLHGTYTTPMAGNTTHRVINHEDQTAAYRFYLQDSIPFRSHIRAGIEHGPRNDLYEKAWTLSYYYHKPEKALVLTDELNIADVEDENKHDYIIEHETWDGCCSYSYEGDFDNIIITDSGRAHRGASGFCMSIIPENKGVIIRRRFDQSIGNQKANVYIDGEFVGVWYKAGSNAYHSWRDDDFMLPVCYTTNKKSIHVKFESASSDIDWNEFKYWAYSIVNTTP